MRACPLRLAATAWLLTALLGCEGADSAPRKLGPGNDTGAPDADAGTDAGCPPGALTLPLGCGEPWLCPEGWHRPDAGYGCLPEPLPTDCPEGSLAVPGVGCTAAWVCPEGWRRLEGTIGCEPPPLPADCPAGSFATPLGCTAPWVCPGGWTRVPGELHCEPHAGECLGDTHPTADGGCAPVTQRPCGAGRFGDGPWPEGTVFVDPDAPGEGADGTASHPHPSLATALAEAEVRTIALSRGRHEISGNLRRSVALLGACADGTALAGSFTFRQSGALALSDLTFEATPGEPYGMAVFGTLSVTRARMRGGDSPLVQIQGPGTATLTEVEFGPGGGMAVVAAQGAVVSLSRAVVHEVTHVALWAQDADTRLEVEQTTVRNIARLADDANSGFGASAQSGSHLGLRDVQILESGVTGVVAADGASAALERVVIRGTHDTTGSGAGLVAIDAATLTGADVVVEDVDSTGLLALHGAQVTVDRYAGRRIRKNPAAGWGGQGAVLRDGASLTLHGAEVRDLEGGGVFAFDGSTVTLQDTLITNLHSEGGDFSPAIALDDAAASLEGVALTRFDETAVQVVGPRGVLQGAGVRIDEATLGGFQSAAVFADRGATVALTDTEISRVFERGAEIQSGAGLRFERVAIRGVTPLPGSPPPNGCALFAVDTGRVDLIDVVVENTVDGIVLQGTASDTPNENPYTLERVVLHGITRSTIAPQDSPMAPLAILGGATARVTDLSLTDFVEIGVFATARTEVALHRAEIRARPAHDRYTIGLAAIHGASFSVDEAHISGVEGPAVFIQDDGTNFTARGLVVEDTGSEVFPGVGLYLGPGAFDADLEDVSVRRTDGTAVAVEGGTVRGRRIELADSERPSERDGRGLWFDTKAQVSLTDVAITDAAALGVILSGAGTRGDLEGLTVARTGQAPTSPENSAAVGVLQGASLQVRRAAIADSASRGVVASTADVRLEGVGIGASGADGVLADGGTLTLDAFSVDGSQKAGLSSTNAQVTLRNGSVTNNRVGVQYELDGKPQMTDTVIEANTDAEVQCSTACVDTPAPPPPPPRFTGGE